MSSGTASTIDEQPVGQPCYADNAAFTSARIVAHSRIADNTWRLRLDCPAIASVAVPGQFAMVRIPHRSDPLLARPLAVYDTFSDDTTGQGGGSPRRYADFIYAVHGRFTTALQDMTVDQELIAWGPLGNGFQIPAVDHLVLVAGGIGQTALLSLGRERLGQTTYGPASRPSPAPPWAGGG
jgi:dihydroorotate dehydrogenase electron transfer subunit